MSIYTDQQLCSVCLEAPVPDDLQAAGLCLAHYTQTIDRTCAVIRRHLASHKVSAEYRRQAATYIVETAILLSRIASNAFMSSDVQGRVLSTFVALMNLLEDLDRPVNLHLFDAARPAARAMHARA